MAGNMQKDCVYCGICTLFLLIYAFYGIIGVTTIRKEKFLGQVSFWLFALCTHHRGKGAETSRGRRALCFSHDPNYTKCVILFDSNTGKPLAVFNPQESYKIV